ncbi:polysaccharide deacetylase family protein [Sphingomonas sp. VDB2]|uniref:polysaccharide deacetylase family protein n=1 Tax=Sphingomonas sp. VDB2 TaxID=3228751 RepID=UPI003A80D176
MTALLITVDTELSSSLHQRGVGLADNVDRSIWAQAQGKPYGIGWQMDLLDRHGLKGVFFLDPMPALVHGADFLTPIVGAIVDRGHEVQMHIHSEWLAWANDSPVGGRQGRNIGDFSFSDQLVLLGLAKRLLEQAGAPAITAFRAGNFGANDDTLRALATLGVAWDSSVNPAYLGRECRISADPAQIGATRLLGVGALPVSGIADRPGGFRPAQICAMSAAEMRAGLRHAVREGHDAFVVVTHSFEMLSRDRQRPNRAVMARFEALCREAARLPGVQGAGFNDLPADLADRPARHLSRAAPSQWRTGLRIAQQAWATWRYEHRLVPA